MQPGETINPSQPPVYSPEPQAPLRSDPAPNSSAPVDTIYHEAPTSSGTEQDGVSWQGSEYVDHEKPAGWYVVLTGVSLVVALVVYVVSQDFVTTFVIAIAAILFGIMAARKPRVLPYMINNSGITIGEKHYVYANFKTFSIVDDTAIHSVVLLPLKRFMPALSLYYPPELENQIVETLGSYLPFAEGGGDAFDRFMTRIHF